MESRNFEPISVLRFVLAFLAVKLVTGSGFALYKLATDDEPSISSTPITIAAVGIAMLWYAKAINRPMSGSEIFRFSIGNTVVDIALSVAWGIGMIWLLSVPFSWEAV